MTTPISAFALHIWDDCNRNGGCDSLKRRINLIKQLSNKLPQVKILNMLQGLSDEYSSDNSSQFINAITHQGSFQAKMDFLAELPGM